MKPKTMILMGLAITCGLGASYMTSRLLAERQTADEPEKVEILVAIKNLSVHQKIYSPEDLFERKLIAKENEPTDAIRDFDQLKGKSLKVGRLKGDHVTAANLYDKGQLDIPEGHQAVGIRVNVETTASGLASLPGSQVDLLLSMESSDLRGKKTIVLLQSVLVLAADIRVTPDGEIAAPAQVVTFALKQKEVLEVTTAKTMGQITLVLRKKDDYAQAKYSSMTGGRLLDDRIKAANEEKPVETIKPVDAPKPEPKPEVKPAPTPEPKIFTGFYDLVNGAESGQRTVTRVHWSQTEDGEVTIVRTEIIDVTGGGGSAPPAPAPAGGQQKRGGLGGGREF